MGLTPLEGLVMGTRSGDVDPGMVFHLLRNGGMDADQIDNLLNRRSGLLGADVVPVTLKAAKEKLGVKKVAVMYGNDDAFTKSAYDVMKGALLDEHYLENEVRIAHLNEALYARRPAAVERGGVWSMAEVLAELLPRYGVPVPVVGTHSIAMERHRGHIGPGGWRRVPHDAQRWIRRRCSRTPSQKNSVSGETLGASRVLM